MPTVYLHPILANFKWIKLNCNPKKYTLFQPLPIRSYPVFQFRVGSDRNYMIVEPKTFFKLALGKPIFIRWQTQRRLRMSIKKKIRASKKKKTVQFILRYPANDDEKPLGWFVIWEEKHKLIYRKWTLTIYETKPKIIATGINKNVSGDYYYKIFIAISPEPNMIKVMYFGSSGARLRQFIKIPPT